MEDRIGSCTLTGQASRQLRELEDDERALVHAVLDHLESAEDIWHLGRPVGSSPAGDVWRLRAGPVGVFVAVDHDDLLVVGFAARRDGWAW